MSRRAAQTDSLDLLLDTICNTFGGVLFIAILVVILLQLSTDSQHDQSQEPIAPDEYRRLQVRHSEVISELSEMRKMAASRESIITEFASPGIQALIQEQRRVTSQRDQLQTTLDNLTSKNLAVAEETVRTRAANTQVQESLKTAQVQWRSLQDQLNELRDSRVHQLALPVAKSTFGKGEIAVIVQHGRMYVWHRYSGFGLRLGLNTDEFVVTGEDETSSALITQPKPTAGIQLEGSEATQRAIRERLSQFSPSEHYMSVVVRPDSFGQFQYLRDTLIDIGGEYRLMPAAEGDAVLDRGGRGGKVQ